MAEFGVQKPWEQPPKTNASKSRSRTKRQRKQKALRIEAGTNLPLVWALPDGVAPPELDQDVAKVIRARLGFVPTNLLRVHTCDARPAVLELYPLRRQPVEERAPRRRGASGPVQPWPTTYWFVDESLSARIAALEARGWVGRLERRLNGDEEALRAAEAAHAAAGLERWAALTAEDRVLAESRGWQKALRDVGIAGIKSARKVKCLHAQYAHFIGAAVVSPVGRWIGELLDDGMDSKAAPVEECVFAVVDDGPKLGGRDRAHKREAAAPG